jgi:hypothetical protein
MSVVLGNSGLPLVAGQVLFPTVLNTLSLSNYSFSKSSPAGTVIGAVQGRTTGSTLSILPLDNRVAIDGLNNLIVGLGIAQEGAFVVTIREAAPNGTLKDTTLYLSVTAAGESIASNALTYGYQGPFLTYLGQVLTYGAAL